MQKLRFEEFLGLKRCVHKEAERMVKEYAEIGEVTTHLKLTRERLMDLHFVVNQVLPSKVGIESLGNGMWMVKEYAEIGEVTTHLKLTRERLMDLHFVVNQVLPSKVGIESLGNGMWSIKILATDKEFFNFVKMLDDDLEVIAV